MGKAPNKQWYSEFCSYRTKKEKREAYRYLTLWKKFLMKKLPERLYFKEEKWSETYNLTTITLEFCMAKEKNDKGPKKDSKKLKKVGINKLEYADIKYGIDNWVDAKKFAPFPFDLVSIKTNKKTFNGWYTGAEWYAIRLSDGEHVLCWKRRKEVYT